MTIEILNSYSEVVDLIGDKIDDSSIAINVAQNAAGQFRVEIQPRKQYLDADNKLQFDEVWITKDGDMKQVQDLTEDHVKNILRMLLKAEREARMEYVNQLASVMEQALAEDEDLEEDEAVQQLREAISAKLAKDNGTDTPDLDIPESSFFVGAPNTLQ